MTIKHDMLRQAETTLAALKRQCDEVSMNLTLKKKLLKQAQDAVNDGEVDYNDLVLRVQACQRAVMRIKREP